MVVAFIGFREVSWAAVEDVGISGSYMSISQSVTVLMDLTSVYHLGCRVSISNRLHNYIGKCSGYGSL